MLNYLYVGFLLSFHLGMRLCITLLRPDIINAIYFWNILRTNKYAFRIQRAMRMTKISFRFFFVFFHVNPLPINLNRFNSSWREGYISYSICRIHAVILSSFLAAIMFNLMVILFFRVIGQKFYLKLITADYSERHLLQSTSRIWSLCLQGFRITTKLLSTQESRLSLLNKWWPQAI